MISKPLLLTVDRNSRNLELLAQVLDRSGYAVLPATNMQELTGCLQESVAIKLALIDISGFDRTIWNYCDRLHHLHVPFLIVAPKSNVSLQQESLMHGARSTLVKPLGMRELIGAIRCLVSE